MSAIVSSFRVKYTLCKLINREIADFLRKYSSKNEIPPKAEITKLLVNVENIRNIGIAAHIGMPACVFLTHLND